MKSESFIIRHETDLAAHSAGLRSSRLNAFVRSWMAGVLFLCDVCALALALAGAIGIYLGFRIVFDDYGNLLGVLLVAFIICFWRYGLYPSIGLSYAEELRRIVEAASFAFLIAITYTFLVKTTTTYSRITLVIAWLLVLGLTPTLRYIVRKVLCNWGIWGEPVVVIGDLDRALPLANYLLGKPQYGVRPVAILRQENCKASFSDRYPCLNVDNIRTVADQLYIRSALVVINDLNYIDRTLDRYRSIFPTVILIKHQIGTWGLSSLKPLDFADVMGFQVRNNLLNPWAQFLKRFIDITVTALCLLFFSPFLAFIWLVIRLDSPGNPYYRQMRLGRNGRVFYLLKFRSMRTDADQVLQEKLAADPALRNEWNQYQKLKDDPRITRVGYWLRKFSLDELPQLWNVFVGEMSLVGPRPMMIDQEKIYGEEYRDYIRVTPGMTGLWQISGRNQTTFTRRAMLDCEYIQKWSIWLDIYILMMTIKVVLFPQGAY